jgi:K+ transporter
LLVAGFLAIDLSFLSANLIKIEHGGWVPLVMAAGVYALMRTWKRGRMQLGSIQEAGALPLDRLRLPEGFTIAMYASGVKDARSLARGAKGTIFVGSRMDGSVHALVDADGDQRGAVHR